MQVESSVPLEKVTSKIAERIRIALVKRLSSDVAFGARLRQAVETELARRWEGDAEELSHLAHLAALHAATGGVKTSFCAAVMDLLADFVAGACDDVDLASPSPGWYSSSQDCLGPLWEAAQPRARRRQHGQFYSAIDPIDLIVAWCVRQPGDRVLDPACGSGAFLIRAWSRLQALAAATSDGTLPQTPSLIGVDVDPASLLLSDVNLVARQAHYDLRRADFFALDPAVLPAPQAVLGNPPYTRQELLSEAKVRAAAAIKRNWGKELDAGRAGFHVPFIAHALAFLPHGGRLGFLVSNSWLNAVYGAALRRLLLAQCAIEAIIAPSDEAWFSAAIKPVVLIVRREPDQGAREEHEVSLIRLKRPLGELIDSPADGSDRWQAVDRLRARIEESSGRRDGAWRGIAIPQRQLRDDDWSNAEHAAPVVSGKWWGYLVGGADVTAELARCCRPLRAFATVRRGITTGANAFFYVRCERPLDEADEPDGNGDSGTVAAGHSLREAPTEASTLKGATTGTLGRTIVRVVAGDGSRHEIETAYLRPVITTSKEVAGLVVSGRQAQRKVVLLPADRSALAGTKAGEYLAWGERCGFGRGVTCAARRAWWHLDPAAPGALLWCKTHYARHVVALNEGALADCNLYHVSPLPGRNPLLLAAALNSAIVALFKELHGRANLGEGALKTEVCDLLGMPVPDIDLLAARLDRITLAPLLVRPASRFSEEMRKPDRRRFDEAIIAALGVHDPERLCSRLYAALHETLAERLERRGD